ncbi:MAG TPA: C45 family autoproteolytic acyltransferase/hydrolase [Planctomycetota bacterium]|nr:C45 family autoproteolytic acyltransferase/hydrolase [Planctomycetota bacterium]
MKTRLLLLPLLLAVGAAPGVPLEIQERHGKSFRGTIDGFPVLMLRGTHRERGEAHGRLEAAAILSILDEVLIPYMHKLTPGSWERKFLRETAAFSFPARYEEELAGMLDGLRAALPRAEDRTLKSLQREIRGDDLKALNCLSDILGAGCSSFSAWGGHTADGTPIVGRNLDYYAFPLSSKAVLLACEPAEAGLKATVDVLMPGFIGVGTALNSDGAFLALHDEKGLPGAATTGWVPRSLALRSAIESASGAAAVADVAAALQGVPVRVGNNVHVCGTAGPSSVLEWDGNAKDGGVTSRGPEGHEMLVCTNHYCLREKAEPRPDSGGRFEKVSRGLESLAAADRKIDLAAARKLLEGVGRSGPIVTHLSYVAWPAARRWTFAVSPQTGVSATKGPWIALEWKDVFIP